MMKRFSFANKFLRTVFRCSALIHDDKGRLVVKRRRLSQFGDVNRSRLTTRVQVELPTKIAVVSDTHSALHPNASSMLETMAPSMILHAGDIGHSRVLNTLRGIAPLIAVRGNIDSPTSNIPDDVILELEANGRLISTWLLTHIAVRGPRLFKSVLSAAQKGRWSMVICGHSHVPLLSQQEGVTIFNPGSVGPRRFHLPIVIGEVSITQTEIRCRHLSCETRGVWLPQ